MGLTLTLSIHCFADSEPDSSKVIHYRVQKILEFISSEEDYERTLSLILNEKIDDKNLIDTLIDGRSLNHHDTLIFQESKKALKGLYTESYTFNLMAKARMARATENQLKDRALLETLEGLLIERFGPALHDLVGLYKVYNGHFSHMSQVLNQLEKKKTSGSSQQISQFLDHYKEVETKRGNKNFLALTNSLFIAPVQRLIKYRNLLEDLTKEKYSLQDKNTRLLEDLKENIEKAAEDVNAHVKEMEDEDKSPLQKIFGRPKSP